MRFSENADVSGGRRLIERGLELIEGDSRSRRIAMGAYAHLVRLHTIEGQTRSAVTSTESLLELCKDEDSFLTAFALGSRGSALSDHGDLKAAVAACEEAVGIAERAGNDVATGMAWGFLAQVLVQAGRPEDVFEASDRAAEAGRRTDQLGAIYHATTWRGEAWLLLGDPEAAAREFDYLVEINPRWPSTSFRVARGRLALGRHADAVRLARECTERGHGRVVHARALCTLGAALGFDSTYRDEAERRLLESIALLDHLELRPHLAEARIALAELCARRGDAERAQNQAEQAHALYLACGADFHARRMSLIA